MRGWLHRCIFWVGTALALGLSTGCHLFNLNQSVGDKPGKELAGPVAPGKHVYRQSQFVFLYDFDLHRDPALFHELDDLRAQVYKELQLPVSDLPIHVYIFEDRVHYEQFMAARHPDLPKRRAFFLAQAHKVGGPEDLMVYTYWGDKIREDLRHELTHALLHSVLKDVPLWLDEGLAEYYEVPPEVHGTNYAHLNQLRQQGAAFRPDLNRLEQLSKVEQMTPAEYREAWAWVHLMLRDSAEAKAPLLAYLQKLRTDANPGPLGPALAAVFPDLDESLERHLARLDSGTNPTPMAQRQ